MDPWCWMPATVRNQPLSRSQEPGLPPRLRPEDPQHQECTRMLLLVADEQDRVAASPHLLGELLAHEVFPVGPVADVAPKSDDLPVNDGLFVAVAAIRCALVVIPEPPRHHLEVGLLDRPVVEQAVDALHGFSTLMPCGELLVVAS